MFNADFNHDIIYKNNNDIHGPGMRGGGHRETSDCEYYTLNQQMCTADCHTISTSYQTSIACQKWSERSLLVTTKGVSVSGSFVVAVEILISAYLDFSACSVGIIRPLGGLGCPKANT